MGGGHRRPECPTDPTTGCHRCVPWLGGLSHTSQGNHTMPGPGDQPGSAVTAGRTGLCPRPAVPPGREGMENQPFPPPEGDEASHGNWQAALGICPWLGPGFRGECSNTKSSLFGGVKERARGGENNLFRHSKHENKWKKISLVFHTRKQEDRILRLGGKCPRSPAWCLGTAARPSSQWPQVAGGRRRVAAWERP